MAKSIINVKSAEPLIIKVKESRSMAECQYCNQEMLKAKSCDYPFLINGEEKIKRIKFGKEDWVEDLSLNKKSRCGDCGVLFGGYHHANCDIERCPKCKVQLLSCSCDFPQVGRK